MPDKARHSVAAATVIAVHGAWAQIRSSSGKRSRVRVSRNLESLVCGDEVHVEVRRGTGRIIEVLPRKTLLARPLRSGSIRPVAANLDLAVLVVAPIPTTPLSFIDRCLVNLELQSLDSIIIFNKQDMGMGEAYEALQKIYQDAGYDTLACSAKSGQGLEELRARLAERASLMLGVSGAGKSSLARTLIPGADIAIGDLGGNGLHGAHTTSVSKLMDLPNGGVLVDTPGVRDFGTWQLEPTQVAFGFREFEPYLGECRYRDCRHDQDPDCAVRAAFEAGEIAVSRRESYLEILHNCDAAQASRYD